MQGAEKSWRDRVQDEFTPHGNPIGCQPLLSALTIETGERRNPTVKILYDPAIESLKDMILE